MNCKTCTHWQPQTEADAVRLTVPAGYCGAIPPIWDVTKRKYNSDGQQDALSPNPGTTLPLAMAEDGEQYIARLVTLPEFGCVLHKPA
jgi:hypothetical protein